MGSLTSLSEALGGIFGSRVYADFPSSQLSRAMDVPEHTISYYVADMRLCIYTFGMPVYETQMAAAGYYTLQVPPDRIGALAVANTFANRVHWMQIDEDDPIGMNDPQLFGDVGHDLATTEDLVIEPQQAALVNTNVRIQLPPTLYGWITARSSMSKKLMHVPNAIIDVGYRGDLFVPMINTGRDTVELTRGDRVAQIIFQRRAPVQIEKVDRFWAPTDRAANGFGSTGR